MLGFDQLRHIASRQCCTAPIAQWQQGHAPLLESVEERFQQFLHARSQRSIYGCGFHQVLKARFLRAGWFVCSMSGRSGEAASGKRQACLPNLSAEGRGMAASVKMITVEEAASGK